MLVLLHLMGMAKPKSPDSETLVARQMFLYGEGDGVRIVNIPELSEKSGASQKTLRLWVPKWNEELEETLRSGTKLASPGYLSVPDEVLEAHKSDLSFIRQRLDEVKSENTQLDSIIANLERIVDQISANFEDSGETDKLLRLFDKYLRLSMNKKSLDKHFMDLKSVWDSKIGVDSLKNIQESTAKAVSIAQAKNTPEDQSPKNKSVVSDNVFRKRL